MAEDITTPWFRVEIDVAKKEVSATTSGGARAGRNEVPKIHLRPRDRSAEAV